MYKKYFGLSENPFNVTPDPRFLYSTPHTEEALACLTYGVQARKGFVMLTGDVGTGKTTLLNKLLEWLRTEQIASAFVFNPRLNPFQFLDYAMSDFGLNCESRLKSVILSELNNWLLARHQAGTTAVLIVDEAQDASPELLEEIRLLTNLETPSGKLLQIILSGQQELEMKLRLPEYRQLRQRISLRAKTHPLTLAETIEYIATRLRVAGSDGRQIFSKEAIDAVRKYSEGIPRIINILCEDALMNAYADHQAVVPAEIIEEVARDLELDLYPATAPPPSETCLDDMVQPGVYVNRSRPVAPPPEPIPVVEPPVETEAPPLRPSPFLMGAGPRRAASAQPVVERSLPATPEPVEPQVPATASTAIWMPTVEAPQDAVGQTRLNEHRWADGEATPESKNMKVDVAPSPTATSPSDDEILQQLRGNEIVRVVPPPSVKPPVSVPRPVTPPPPFVVVPKTSSQSRVLWLAIAAALVAGLVGAFLIWRHTGEPVPLTTASAPVPTSVTPAPAPESSTAPDPAAESHASATPPVTAPAEVLSSAPATSHPAPKPEAPASTPASSKPAPQSVAATAPLDPAVRSTSPARPSSRALAQSTEPSEAAPEISGKGVVTSSVEGARISVDGKYSKDWVTPYVFSNLGVGAHTIVVSKAGYQDVVTRMTVREGQTSYFRANLAPSVGEISILTEPPGLPVSVDGGPFQSSPVQLTLTAGPHKYRIQLPNSRVYEGSVDMKAGSIITRRVDFTAGE